jgi:hypothetical protein
VKPKARLLRDSESFVMGAIVAAGLASGLALGTWSVAHADEGGVAFWFSGQFASLSTVPAAPGYQQAR